MYYTSITDAVFKIASDEGVSGLYAGMEGSLLGVASQSFAYFYWYTLIRSFYLSSQPALQLPSTAVELGLGAASGAIAQIFTIPVAVITTRQQTQTKCERQGLVATAKQIVDSEDGWTGLWRGLKASLILVANPAITYGAYQKLRHLIFPGKVSLKPRQAFLLGALSKMVATFITQPLIVAKVGLQSTPPASRLGKPPRSFVEVMQHLIKTEGPLSLFKGIRPQLMKAVLVQGLLMMSKERLELMFLALFSHARSLNQVQFLKATSDTSGFVKSAAADSMKAASSLVSMSGTKSADMVRSAATMASASATQVGKAIDMAPDRLVDVSSLGLERTRPIFVDALTAIKRIPMLEVGQ